MNVETDLKRRVDNRCRVCLLVENSAVHLNTQISVMGESRSFFDILSLCSNFEISINDGKPQSICKICKVNAKMCYEFRLSCEKSNKILETELSNVNYSMEIVHTKLEAASDPLGDVMEVALDDKKLTTFDTAFEDENIGTLDPLLIDETLHTVLQLQKVETCANDLNSDLADITDLDNNPDSVLSSSSKEQFYNCGDENSTLDTDETKCNLANIINKHHPCTSCNSVFDSIETLLKHVLKNHLIVGKCSYCELELKKVKEFILHIKDVHSDITGDFWYCEICGSVFKHKNSFNRHCRKIHKVNNTEVARLNEKKLNTPINRCYPCGNCGRVYTCVYSLLRHVKAYHRDLSKCNYCDYQVSDFSAFRKHIRNEHADETNEFSTCDICGSVFTSRRGMNGHRKSVHNLPDKCKYCEYQCKNLNELRVHMNNVHSDMIPDNKCKYCAFIGSDVDELKAHTKKEHGLSKENKMKELKKKCVYCDFSTNNPIVLGKHLQIEHNGEKKFSCIECNKKFFFNRNLMVHHKNMHSGAKKRDYVCEVCGAQFHTTHNLHFHVRIHTGEKPFKCEHCDKAFNQSSTLATHIKYIHKNLRNFLCNLCGSGFNVRSELRRHQKRHSNERNYKCNWCDKAFKDSKHLSKHKLVHTGVRKFKCDTCGRCFARNTQLTLHMKTHTGEKSHVCNVCGKGFIQAHSLRTHLLRHEND